MNTIYTFLENMFTALPKTAHILKVKEDLYQTMVEKYEDYKKSGKSENEAVGLVISEFGNIDELLEELDIKTDEKNTSIILKDDYEPFLKVYKKQSFRVALGVFLIILGVALGLIVIRNAEELDLVSRRSIMATLLIVLHVIPAIGLFIAAGLEMSSYNHLFEGDYELDIKERFHVEKLSKDFQKKYHQGILFGVLIIISSVVLFVSSAFIERGQALFISLGLFIVGIGVFILIRRGMIQTSYSKLLKKGQYTPEMREVERKQDLVAGVVFPIALLIYLASSFITKRWDITWIIWPIVGVIFMAYAGVLEEIQKNKKKK
jgi:hypothetical protein